MNSRLFILISILVYLYFSIRSTPSSDFPVEDLNNQFREKRRNIGLLSNATYGGFNATNSQWLPLNGFRKEDGFAWGALPLVKEKASNHLRDAIVKAKPNLDPSEPTASLGNITSLDLPVYRNVSGFLHGEWMRWKNAVSVGDLRVNRTALAQKYNYSSTTFALNVTTDDGQVSFVLNTHDVLSQERNGSSVEEIAAKMKIESSILLNDESIIPLHGVHFPSAGNIVLSTINERFSGLSALPYLTLTEDSFELSRKLLNSSLSNSMRNGSRSDCFLPWNSLYYSPKESFHSPKCNYVVYLQQQPVSIKGKLAPNSVLRAIEQELQYPIGAPIPSAQPMVMSTVVYSPDCGFVIQSKASPKHGAEGGFDLSGPQEAQYRIFVKRFLVFITATAVAQAFLLLRQMRESPTPSTRSRISFYTISLMSMGEAIALLFAVLVVGNDAPFLLVSTIAFIGIFSVSFISMKFQMEIYSVHAADDFRNMRSSGQQPATPPAPPNNIEDANASESLPLPATSQRTANNAGTSPNSPYGEQGASTDANNPSSNDPSTAGARMYHRYYILLYLIFMISSWAAFGPSYLGYIYFNMICLVYLSFWTPQIYRNVMRNCHKALQWEFVVGQSISRLLPFVYIRLVPENVFFLKPEPKVACLWIGWVWLQALILVGQHIFGPRFFVPNGWAPPTYDYHPILRDDSSGDSSEDIESGNSLPCGALRAGGRDAPPKDDDQNTGLKEKFFDCAICMHDIEVSILIKPPTSDLQSSGPVNTLHGLSVTENASNLLNRRSYMVTPCRHIFHARCLESWMGLRLQCPMCREPIPPV